VKLFEAFREDLVDNGFILPRHKEILDWCREENNPYMEKHGDRMNWLSDKKLPNKAEIIFFVGCTESYRSQNISRNVIKILEKANVEFGILGENEKCCGSVALRVGKKKLARELAVKNVDAIKNAGAKVVITHCAGCYNTLKNDYPEIIGELPFKILHITEFIEQLIRNGKLKFDKKINEIVTYHDPCHLGRSSNLYDPPRNILQGIPGLKFIEMKRNRENAWCCGAGGGVKSSFPKLALDISIDRIQEVKESNANILTTVCPFCLNNFTAAATEMKMESLEILDLTDLILKTL
jgi:heterodisulfide reductase subunit D